MDVIEVGEPSMERGRAPVRTGYLHPLNFADIVERVASYLKYADLKNARLTNRCWFNATAFVWGKRAQIKFRDIDSLGQFLSFFSTVRLNLPFTVKNWTFEGESITKMMCEEGREEQQVMTPFWPSMECLTFSNWNGKRWRCQPRPPPEQGRRRPRPVKILYITPSKISSGFRVKEMLRLCTNLKELVVQYIILPKMKGAYISPAQFPQLEKLSLFKIYYNGGKFKSGSGQNPADLLRHNLTTSDTEVQLPAKEICGGNTFILRILDHSPNLRRIEVETGTLLSTKIETWFQLHLLNPCVNLPKLADLACSVPLHEIICQGFQMKNWPLRSLHLRTMPGKDYVLQIDTLHDMISSFKDTLVHLELILAGEGYTNQDFPDGSQFIKLESIEIYGFMGEYNFLHRIPNLRKAVVGPLLDVNLYTKLEKYFRENPVPNWIQLELKTTEEFKKKLTQPIKT